MEEENENEAGGDGETEDADWAGAPPEEECREAECDRRYDEWDVGEGVDHVNPAGAPSGDEPSEGEAGDDVKSCH